MQLSIHTLIAAAAKLNSFKLGVEWEIMHQMHCADTHPCYDVNDIF